jgi:predicted dehydrogenase
MYSSNRRSFLGSVLCAATGLAAPTKKYRVAVIGVTAKGNYGHGIDTVWTAFENMEVVAVADPDPSGRVNAVRRIRAKRNYADYREMLRVEKPDLVGIGPRWLD